MEEHSALLELVRAVTVLDGIACEPSETGVRTGPSRSGVITWRHVRDLLGRDDPLDRAPRLRLAVLVLLHRQVAALGPLAPLTVAAAVRPLALPVGHPLHPGPEWVRESVPGGVLDLGIGVTGLVPGQDTLPLPSSVALAAELDSRSAWRRARARGDDLATLALGHVRTGRDRPTVLAGGAATEDVDALTLLAVPAARDLIAGPVAVPSRDRAWLGRRAWDEPFLAAVWMLTPAARRGVLAPLTIGPAGVSSLRPVQRSGSGVGS